EATGQLAADVELDVGVAHQQRLGIRVDRYELDSLEPHLDHAVDGVDAAATDPHHLDDGQVVVRRCHRAQPSLRGGRTSRRNFDVRCRTREGEETLTLY